MPIQFKARIDDTRLLLGESIRILTDFLIAVSQVDDRFKTPVFFKEGFDACAVNLNCSAELVANQVISRVIKENEDDRSLHPDLTKLGAQYKRASGFILGWTYCNDGLDLSFTSKVGGMTGNGFGVLADNGVKRFDYGLALVFYNCAVRHPGIVQAQILPRHIRLLRLYRSYSLVLGLDNYFLSDRPELHEAVHHDFVIRHMNPSIMISTQFRPEIDAVDVPGVVIDQLVRATESSGL